MIRCRDCQMTLSDDEESDFEKLQSISNKAQPICDECLEDILKGSDHDPDES